MLLKTLKKLPLVIGVLALFASCNNESDTNTKSVQMAPVHVQINDFDISVQSMAPTRAAKPLAEYDNAKAITLAFYDGNTEVYKTTQYRGSLGGGETFGEFDLSLPLGSYTMVALAYGFREGDVLTLTSPTLAAYAGDHNRETFAVTQAVNIANTTAVNINATLNRIVAKLDVNSTDGRPAQASSIRVTFSGGSKSFNPTTGLAVGEAGFSNVVSISAAVGNVTSSGSYVFLATDEQTVDVTIEVLNSENTAIFTKQISDVPLKRNVTTILTGSMYTNNGNASFLINSGWGTQTNINF